jgi:hypothetical protein
METIPFGVPITTCSGSPLRFRLVSSVNEAAIFLFKHWPRCEGDCWFAAVKQCNDTLEGIGSSEAARTAFIVAAKDAGILHNADVSLP